MEQVQQLLINLQKYQKQYKQLQQTQQELRTLCKQNTQEFIQQFYKFLEIQNYNTSENINPGTKIHAINFLRDLHQDLQDEENSNLEEDTENNNNSQDEDDIKEEKDEIIVNYLYKNLMNVIATETNKFVQYRLCYLYAQMFSNWVDLDEDREDFVQQYFDTIESQEDGFQKVITLRILQDIQVHMTDFIGRNLTQQYKLIQQNLQSENIEVQMAAIWVLVQYVQVFSEDTEVDYGFEKQNKKDLCINFLQAVSNILIKNAEEYQEEVSEAFLEISEEYPQFFKGQLDQIFRLCLNLVKDKQPNIIITQRNPKFLILGALTNVIKDQQEFPNSRNNMNMKQYIKAIFQLLQPENDTLSNEWLQPGKYADFESIDEFKFQREVIEEIMKPMSDTLLDDDNLKEKWVNFVLAEVKECFQNTDKSNWKNILVGQIAIIGISEALEGDLSIINSESHSYVEQTHNFLNHPHPAVKFTACLTIQNLINSVGEYKIYFTEQAIAKLFGLLQDEYPQIQSVAFQTLQSLIEIEEEFSDDEQNEENTDEDIDIDIENKQDSENSESENVTCSSINVNNEQNSTSNINNNNTSHVQKTNELINKVQQMLITQKSMLYEKVVKTILSNEDIHFSVKTNALDVITVLSELENGKYFTTQEIYEISEIVQSQVDKCTISESKFYVSSYIQFMSVLIAKGFFKFNTFDETLQFIQKYLLDNVKEEEQDLNDILRCSQILGWFRLLDGDEKIQELTQHFKSNNNIKNKYLSKIMILIEYSIKNAITSINIQEKQILDQVKGMNNSEFKVKEVYSAYQAEEQLDDIISFIWKVILRYSGQFYDEMIPIIQLFKKVMVLQSEDESIDEAKDTILSALPDIIRHYMILSEDKENIDETQLQDIVKELVQFTVEEDEILDEKVRLNLYKTIGFVLKECKGQNHFTSGEIIPVSLLRQYIKIQEKFYKSNKEEYIDFKKQIEKLEKEIKKMKNPGEAELQEKQDTLQDLKDFRAQRFESIDQFSLLIESVYKCYNDIDNYHNRIIQNYIPFCFKDAQDYNMIAHGLQFVSDIIEYLGYNKIEKQDWQILYDLVNKFLVVEDAGIIQNCSYILGIMAKTTPKKEFQKYAQKHIDQLNQLMYKEMTTLEDDKDLQINYTKDNISSGILKLIVYQIEKQSDKYVENLAYWFNLQPIKNDADEAQDVIKIIFELLKDENEVAKDNIDIIAKTCYTYFKKEHFLDCLQMKCVVQVFKLLKSKYEDLIESKVKQQNIKNFIIEQKYL